MKLVDECPPIPPREQTISHLLTIATSRPMANAIDYNLIIRVNLKKYVSASWGNPHRHGMAKVWCEYVDKPTR